MKRLSVYGEIMDSRLHAAEQSAKTILERSQAAISIVEEILAEINPILTETQFPTADEEIQFFKQQLPQIHAQLIYHHSVSRLESRKPIGDIHIYRSYYNHELERIRRFSEDYRDLYQYFRMGSTFWDEQLFLRGQEPLLQLKHEYSYAIDARTCTTGSVLVATIRAYDLLRDFIESQSSQVASESTGGMTSLKKRLKWTDSKTALAEMIYGFFFKGCFNNGAADLKEIQAYFEQVFDISVGNLYQIKQEIYARENLTAYQDIVRKRYKDGMSDAV